MMIARVIGNVVAAAQHSAFDARKLMLVRPESPDTARAAPAIIAIDEIGAGPGERVLVMREGSGVRQILGSDMLPIRSVIVGIVDQISHTLNR